MSVVPPARTSNPIRRESSGRVTASILLSHQGAPIESFRALLPPRGYAVYVLVAGDGRTLYVGQSKTPASRIRRHYLNQPWWPSVAAVEVHLAADELDARTLERELHDDLAPVYSCVSWSDELALARLS